MLDELFIPIFSIFVVIGLPVILGMWACFLLIKGRHEERMAMIANGVDPQAFPRVERRPSRYAALRNGIVFIGLSVGLFLGVWLQPLMPTVNGGENSCFYAFDLSLPIMTLLCGGISFIVYFFLSRHIEKKEREEDNLIG